MPWEIDSIMDREMAREGLARLQPMEYIAESMRPMPRTAYGKVATLESALYMRNQLLRDSDWASMAHGLEVRVPLVDFQLLKRIGGKLAASGIANCKNLLGLSPHKPVPQSVLRRVKTGFATPIENWLQRSTKNELWRGNPVLVNENCPWARRWAYSVAAT
jgi:asparagine synthase (glutamine-hydrolysing)